MKKIRDNLFWVVLGGWGLVLLMLFLFVVWPAKGKLYIAFADLEQSKQKLTAALSGESVNAAKIAAARKTVEKLSAQKKAVIDYFLRGEEKVVYWPEVIAGGRLQCAIFKDVYERKTAELERACKAKMKVDDEAFPWTKFGAEVPSAEKCEPAMKTFRFVEKLLPVLLESGAVVRLRKIGVGSTPQRLFSVGDVVFYLKPFKVSALVEFPRLPALIAGLESLAEGRCTVRLVDLCKAEEADGFRKEPPVQVVLECGIIVAEKEGGRKSG